MGRDHPNRPIFPFCLRRPNRNLTARLGILPLPCGPRIVSSILPNGTDPLKNTRVQSSAPAVLHSLARALDALGGLTLVFGGASPPLRIKPHQISSLPSCICCNSLAVHGGSRPLVPDRFDRAGVGE
jgi:hypothetical protein